MALVTGALKEVKVDWRVPPVFTFFARGFLEAIGTVWSLKKELLLICLHGCLETSEHTDLKKQEN